MKRIRLLLESFFEYQQGCGYSPNTIERNRYFLGRFAKWLNGEDVRGVTWKKISDYREYLMQVKHYRTGKSLSPSTVLLEMLSVKSFFDYLLNQEKILINPLEGIKLTVPGAGERARPVFTEEDISMFLDSIRTDLMPNQRDRAIFELTYSSGLRASEVLKLKCEHVDMKERVLIVKGKGNKERYVPFSEAARAFLRKYISGGRKELEKGIRKKENKRYLFLGAEGGLCYEALMRRFHKYLKGCGLDNKGYTIHSIRHSTATHLLGGGAGIRYVQELLGHEDLKTTQLYTRPTEENIRGVYKTYHPRENLYFKEVDGVYLKKLKALKARLIWGEKAGEQYRRYGHKKGFGGWKEDVDDS